MAVMRLTFRSEKLRASTDVHIIYPLKRNSFGDPEGRIPQYTISQKKYKVLWLIHGGGECCSDWFRFSMLEAYAAEHNIAVICPNIENGFGIDIKRGDPWESYLTGPLRSAVFSMFPAISDRQEENYIAGVSMGGYAALRLAFRHRDLYGKAAAIDSIAALQQELLSYWWNEQQLNYVFGSVDHMQAAEYQLDFCAKTGMQNSGKLPVYLNCSSDNRQFGENKKLAEKLQNMNWEVVFKECKDAGTLRERRDRQLKDMFDSFL